MKIRLKSLLLLLVLLLGSSGARALCLPALCTCTVQVTNLAFGTYNPLAFGNTDSSSSVQVKCGGVVGLLIPFSIGLSSGGGSFANRRMANGANLLYYNLHTDASYTSVWGDGTGSTLLPASSVLLDALGLAPAKSFTLYGRLPGRQLTVAPGTYTDTLNITVTYF